MTEKERCHEAAESGPTGIARDAGFSLTRRQLEELVAAEFGGMVADPTLLSTKGLWATFLAREPCCGARVMLNVRARDPLDQAAVDDVFRMAARDRDTRHPAVLPVRRFGRTDDLLWVTTRAQRGRLLRLRFGSGPSMARTRAVEFLRRVARPLDAVHREGFAHGALSEASFHCDAEGRIRIRNLGFEVPVLRSLVRHGVDTDVGACAAPELREGSTPRPESDQYALAAIILAAMTGEAPSRGRVDWNAVPAEMRPVLRRALRPDPEERFASVLEMWEALDPGATTRSHAPGAAAAMEEPLEAWDDPAPAPSHDHEPPPSHDQGPAPAAEAGRDPYAHPAQSPPSTDGVGVGDGLRRRRGRDSSPREAGPWARTLAAAAVLVLFVGSLEWVDEWQRFSPLALLDDSAPAATDPNMASPEPTMRGVATSRPIEDTRASDDIGASGIEPLTGLDTVAPAERTTSGEAPIDEPAGQSRPERPEPEPTPRPTPDASTPDAEPMSRTPGVLSLHSYPWGEVYLDGDYVGNTPIVQLRVLAGEHEVRIERAGYEPYVETITVEPGETVRRTGIVLPSGSR